MIGAMSLIACALLAFVSMPRDLKGGTLFALGCLGAVSAWVYSQSRDPKRYSRVVFRWLGVSHGEHGLGLCAGCLFTDASRDKFSISFFGLSNDRIHSRLICLYSILGYLVMTLLVTVGVIETEAFFVHHQGPLRPKSSCW